MINKDYFRVIPRDLFNESKLLKCVGKLVVAIEDKKTPIPNIGYGVNEGEPFKVALDEDNSCLTLLSVEISICRVIHRFVTNYNSRLNYPLVVESKLPGLEDAYVFDEEGEFSEDFINYCRKFLAKKYEPNKNKTEREK